MPLRQIAYQDFDVLMEKSGNAYRARVLNSPTGQTQGIPFELPFAEMELENFLLRIGRPRRAVRGIGSAEKDAVKAFGGRLYEALFKDDLGVCLRSSMDDVHGKGDGLRIRLRLSDCPELADVPWEYLFNRQRNSFLCLSDQTPLVRYLELPQAIHALGVEPPLKMLVMISNPVGSALLDVDEEWAKLQEALAELAREGLVALDRVERPTMAGLHRRLLEGEYHIFHFIGHGGFDPSARDGALVMEGEGGTGRLVSGEELGTLLRDQTSLRLAVLNACEGARGDRADPFAGTAQRLVQQGVPAVIAMQFEITDQAAITFSQTFYYAVSLGYPVDAALSEARKAILANANEVEWATPVLYMRSPDGRIFDITVRPVLGEEASPLPEPENVTPSDDMIPTAPSLEGDGRAEPGPTAAPPETPGRRVTFTDTGKRFLLGYGRDYYGIWDRLSPGPPIERYPMTDEGWKSAWREYWSREAAGTRETRISPPAVTTPGPQPAIAVVTGQRIDQPVSGAWWLMPIVFNWLGGLIAWLAIKERNPRKARAMLITGIVIAVFLIIVAAAASSSNSGY